MLEYEKIYNLHNIGNVQPNAYLVIMRPLPTEGQYHVGEPHFITFDSETKCSRWLNSLEDNEYMAYTRIKVHGNVINAKRVQVVKELKWAEEDG